MTRKFRFQWAVKEDVIGQFTCLSFLCYFTLISLTSIKHQFVPLAAVILLAVIIWYLAKNLIYQQSELSYEPIYAQFTMNTHNGGITVTDINCLPLNFIRMNTSKGPRLVHLSVLETGVGLDAGARQLLTLTHWCRQETKSAEDSQEG